MDIHHSGTLGDDPKLLEQVKLGAIDLAISGIAMTGNQIPELGLLALPYLVESYEQGWALYDTSPWVKEWLGKLQTKNMRAPVHPGGRLPAAHGHQAGPDPGRRKGDEGPDRLNDSAPAGSAPSGFT